MTIGQLRTALNTYPDEKEIVISVGEVDDHGYVALMTTEGRLTLSYMPEESPDVVGFSVEYDSPDRMRFNRAYPRNRVNQR